MMILSDTRGTSGGYGFLHGCRPDRWSYIYVSTSEWHPFGAGLDRFGISGLQFPKRNSYATVHVPDVH